MLDSVAKLRDSGFIGMTIPTALDGGGLSHLDSLLVIEEMARCCPIMGRITVEANMGAIGAVMKYGFEGQKRLAAHMFLVATSLRYASQYLMRAVPPLR